jgi:hypothetical protein
MVLSDITHLPLTSNLTCFVLVELLQCYHLN